MNATPPTELFLISPRWLAEQQLLTAVSYRPGFIDAAQVQCGPEPFDAAMKDQAPRTHEEYDRWVLQFRSWNDCIDLLRARNQKADSTIIAALIDQIDLSTHPK